MYAKYLVNKQFFVISYGALAQLDMSIRLLSGRSPVRVRDASPYY